MGSYNLDELANKYGIDVRLLQSWHKKGVLEERIGETLLKKAEPVPSEDDDFSGGFKYPPPIFYREDFEEEDGDKYDKYIHVTLEVVEPPKGWLRRLLGL